MLDAHTDPDLSALYRELLDEKLRGQVLDDKDRFCCTHGRSCQDSVRGDRFAAGQLSYVGDHYAAKSLGQPMRILVVSMQVGDDEAPVTMARRREQIRGRIPETLSERNQHMAGVTTALRLLYGGNAGDDPTGEALATESGPVHVLDAYAMANSVLCSRRPGPGREGAPTSTMIANCGQHLLATIETLEPTIIHSQGRSQGWSTHRAVERLADRVHWVDDHVARIQIAGIEAIWCSLKHPARNWGQLRRQYLYDTAAPALRRTRGLALGL